MRGKKLSEATTPIGQWLDEYCEQEGIFISDLARNANIEASQLYKARRGDSEPHEATLLKLAAYLGGTIAQVYGGDGHVRFIHNKGDELWVLSEAMKMFTDEERRMVNVAVQAIKNKKAH